jgi:cysteine desulfurase/selenocysteine lyase
MESNRRDFLGVLSRAASLSAIGKAGLSWDSMAASPSIPADSIREDFPELRQKINGAPLVYLDSAATTLRPRAVIEAISSFYQHDNANPSTATHTLARRSASLYESARETIARFINAASPAEIVWTRGTTEAINLVASSCGSSQLRSGDGILVTRTEHYSNLVPWRLAAERAGASLLVLDVDNEGQLRLDQLDALLAQRVKIVAFGHVSNVLGRINPAAEICARAHRVGALVLIDAAQSIPHIPVDVQALGCDFLAFSGHKMLGPMGIGVLWGRKELLNRLPPYQGGSNMVHDVASVDAALSLAEGGHKFEAGTPNVAGPVGLVAAVQYLESLGRAEVWKREQALTAYALERLRTVPGLRVLGSTDIVERISVFSFTIEGVPPLDIVRALDERGIAIRAGDLAALPLLKRLGVSAAARASCYLYTERSDIDAAVEALGGLKPRPS